MKSPAFQFYPDDFIGGTMGMSTEDVGAYIRLLCYQWGNGSIPLQKAVIDRIAGCCVSQMVMDKFKEGKNPRLESVRTKQQAFSETQRKKANMLWQSRGNAGASNGHMPTVCSPISDLHSPSPIPIPSPKTVRFAPPSLQDVTLYASEILLNQSECQKFINYYESNGWMVGRNKMKSWKAAMRNWQSRNSTPTAEPKQIQENITVKLL